MNMRIYIAAGAALAAVLILMSGCVVSEPPQRTNLLDPQNKAGQLLDDYGLTMVTILGGEFTMGSTAVSDEQPVRTVTVNSFMISSTEITQGTWRQVMGQNPSAFTGNDNLPVENVSWNEAMQFCNRLSDIAGLDQCYNIVARQCDFTKSGFRLPTEAEWEYVCRAGSTYVSGAGMDPDSLAWHQGNSDGATHPAGTLKANAMGVYDMFGNVSEWVNDHYGGYNANDTINPTGPPQGLTRSIRGGSWNTPVSDLRCPRREQLEATESANTIGFRVVRGDPFLPNTND